jgi:hypothetical protein
MSNGAIHSHFDTDFVHCCGSESGRTEPKLFTGSMAGKNHIKCEYGSGFHFNAYPDLDPTPHQGDGNVFVHFPPGLYFKASKAYKF